jgi:glycosyltransferase involved in cell wall biosynthesis
VRVLLLSAYDADSHRYWRERLCAGISDWQWCSLTLPARHFSWRIRGNPLYWSLAERQTLERDYDLVLATSMVDLATLRGLVPQLARAPAVLYFHENQFAYPANRGRHGALEAQMVSLYAGLSAQRLLFNSRYNLDTFMAGCDGMLQAFPDSVPPGVIDALRARASVLPVPMDFPEPAVVRDAREPLQLVWNHRWEYDKGPEHLLAIANALLCSGVNFVLHVVGRQFREQAPEFAALHALLRGANAIGYWGFIEDSEEYMYLLHQCDVALSTALHDFQGLALMQACAAGCSPLAPSRLVYPEWLGEDFLYPGYDDVVREAAGAVARIARLAEMKSRGETLPLADVSRFGVPELIPRYRRVLREVAEAGGSPAA